MRIHHYGLATKNIERTVGVFRSLGYQVSEPVFDPLQKVNIVFVKHDAETPIELVCDSEPSGPTTGLFSKIGSSLYHICYQVDNIEKMIQALRQQGFLLRHKPVPATAFKGKRIAWLYNQDIGMIELLEQ
jgi:methylmalonyl-CoA/ethylmalonyl-CoA epimerase